METEAQPVVFKVLKSESRATAGTDWTSLLTLVAAAARVSKKALLGRRRDREIAVPRHVLCYLARKLTGISLQQIGAKLDGRDHSSILYSVHRVEEGLRKGDPYYKRLVRAGVDEFSPGARAPWSLEIVDPDPAGVAGRNMAGYIKSPPGFRVLYTRPDGTEFVAVLPMSERPK